MNTLRGAADKVIQLGQSLNGQLDGAGYFQAYDELLWAIVTSPPEELATFAPLLFDTPYIDLPVPLQVALFRIVGLELSDDPEKLRLVKNGIAMYCTPTEEQHATQSIDVRLSQLSSQR